MALALYEEVGEVLAELKGRESGKVDTDCDLRCRNKKDREPSRSRARFTAWSALYSRSLTLLRPQEVTYI
jgi:hypothetical protein